MGDARRGLACTAADFAGTAIGAAQVSGDDVAAIHAPWLLDPGLTSDLIVGTCRAWRGARERVADDFGRGRMRLARRLGRRGRVRAVRRCRWCGRWELAGTGEWVGERAERRLGGDLRGAGGDAGWWAERWAGMCLRRGREIRLRATTAWTDAARGVVTNDAADAGVFNPGGFDVSSVAVDAHDATGQTVYVTAMGFAGSGTNAPHVYRSVDGGGHWTNVSSNLPNAPANSVVVDPNDANTLYVGMDTGVYVTTAVTGCVSTNCWSVLGGGAAECSGDATGGGCGNCDGGWADRGVKRAGTYGRGIWQIPLLTAASPAVPAMALKSD